MINKIVIRYADGNVKKGTTSDFFPNKTIFHLTEKNGGGSEEININDLKAVFFVKNFEGDRDYQEKDQVVRVGLGKEIRVDFHDGESITGYTQGFSPARPGFIVFPADPDSNNERVFVITAATSKVKFS